MTWQTVLDSREKALPGSAYKMSGGASPYGMDMLIQPEKDVVDEQKMCCRIPFCSGVRRDGVGDILEVGGVDTSRHVMNALCLFDHAKKVDLPIGMAWEWNSVTGKYDSSKYTVCLDPISREGYLDCYFYQGKGLFPALKTEGEGGVSSYDHALFCSQLFHMRATGLVRGGSIGYQVIAARELSPDYETGTPKGLHLLKTLMLEGSLVVLPANMDTVVKVLSMPTVCGKKLSPYLVKSLSAYAPPKKAQLGYEGKKSADEEILHEKGRFRAVNRGGYYELQSGVKTPQGEIRWGHEGSDPSEERAKQWVELQSEHRKGLQQIPNYKPTSNDLTSCATCQAYSADEGGEGHCSMFKTLVRADHTCDDWEAKKSPDTNERPLKDEKAFVPALPPRLQTGDRIVTLPPSGRGMAEPQDDKVVTDVRRRLTAVNPDRYQNEVDSVNTRLGHPVEGWEDWYRRVGQSEAVANQRRQIAASYRLPLLYDLARLKHDTHPGILADRLEDMGHSEHADWVRTQIPRGEPGSSVKDLRRAYRRKSITVPVPDDIRNLPPIPPARWRPGVGAVKALRTKYKSKAGQRLVSRSRRNFLLTVGSLATLGGVELTNVAGRRKQRQAQQGAEERQRQEVEKHEEIGRKREQERIQQDNDRRARELGVPPLPNKPAGAKDLRQTYGQKAIRFRKPLQKPPSTLHSTASTKFGHYSIHHTPAEGKKPGGFQVSFSLHGGGEPNQGPRLPDYKAAQQYVQLHHDKLTAKAGQARPDDKRGRPPLGRGPETPKQGGMTRRRLLMGAGAAVAGAALGRITGGSSKPKQPNKDPERGWGDSVIGYDSDTGELNPPGPIYAEGHSEGVEGQDAIVSPKYRKHPRPLPDSAGEEMLDREAESERRWAEQREIRGGPKQPPVTQNTREDALVPPDTYAPVGTRVPYREQRERGLKDLRAAYKASKRKPRAGRKIGKLRGKPFTQGQDQRRVINPLTDEDRSRGFRRAMELHGDDPQYQNWIRAQVLGSRKKKSVDNWLRSKVKSFNTALGRHGSYYVVQGDFTRSGKNRYEVYHDQHGFDWEFPELDQAMNHARLRAAQEEKHTAQSPPPAGRQGKPRNRTTHQALPFERVPTDVGGEKALKSLRGLYGRKTIEGAGPEGVKPISWRYGNYSAFGHAPHGRYLIRKYVDRGWPFTNEIPMWNMEYTPHEGGTNRPFSVDARSMDELEDHANDHHYSGTTDQSQPSASRLRPDEEPPTKRLKKSISSGLLIQVHSKDLKACKDQCKSLGVVFQSLKSLPSGLIRVKLVRTKDEDEYDSDVDRLAERYGRFVPSKRGRKAVEPKSVGTKSVNKPSRRAWKDEQGNVIDPPREYHHLYDYSTNQRIRRASAGERRSSEIAAEHDGGAGVINVNGRHCYVKALTSTKGNYKPKGRFPRQPVHPTPLHEEVVRRRQGGLGGRCGCTDPGCPAHHGQSRCVNNSTMNLYRIDMEDDFGTPMCDDCADDALESGVFSTEHPDQEYDEEYEE